MSRSLQVLIGYKRGVVLLYALPSASASAQQQQPSGPLEAYLTGQPLEALSWRGSVPANMSPTASNPRFAGLVGLRSHSLHSLTIQWQYSHVSRVFHAQTSFEHE